MALTAVGWRLPCWIAGCALAATVLLHGGAPAGAEPELPVVPWDQAEKHIGEEAVVEGTIVATHASPLSTLLAFDASFNRFTAVIQAADRNAFPPDPEERYRGKQVRVKGRIEEYANKPEVVLRSPSQIEVLEPPQAAAPPPPAPAPPRGGAEAELMRELLARLAEVEIRMLGIEERLDRILASLEQARQASPAPLYVLPGAVAPYEAPARPASEALRTVKRGMTLVQVRRLAGDPIYVEQTSEGGQTWYYGGGRSVSFDNRDRVQALGGFQTR
jgi:hypothetical protein